MLKDLSAYTPAATPQGYVPFVNISELEDGSVRIIVRSGTTTTDQVPIAAAISLPRADAIELFSSALTKLG